MTCTARLFVDLARSPDHLNSFIRSRKLPLPTLLAALLSFRGGSVQSELDALFASLGAGVLVSDRALAKARSKLLAPALWALNDRLIDGVQGKGQLRLFKGCRLVCADGTVLAPAQHACLRTLSLAAHVQRVLGLHLPGYHGRRPIEEAFKRLKHPLGPESVSGLSQYALLVDVATKVLADSLAAPLNRAVLMPTQTPQGVGREVNCAAAAKLISRCFGSMLLVAGRVAEGVHDCVLTLSPRWTRHIPGCSRPRNPAHSKPHPSQSYKRAA